MLRSPPEDLVPHLSAILVLINHIFLFGIWVPRRYSFVVANKMLAFNLVVTDGHTPLLYFSFRLSLRVKTEVCT